MSRIIVRGLPSKSTEPQLRQKFGEFGTLTDCALKYTKEGKFRRMAFIGFNDEAEAQRAIQHWNGAYMGTAKLIVEVCRPFGDAGKPRPWSKYAAGSSAHASANPQLETSSSDSKTSADAKSSRKRKPDAKLSSFLELHGQTVEAENADDGEGAEKAECSGASLERQLFDGIAGDLTSSVVISGLPVSIKQTSLKQFLAPVKPKVMRVVRDDDSAAALVTFARKPDQKRVLARDNEFLGGFKLHIVEASTCAAYTAPVAAKKGRYADGAEPQQVEDEIVKNEQAQTELILDTGRLLVLAKDYFKPFVRNLPYTVSVDDLTKLFNGHGPTVDIRLIVDREGKPKGYALVTYMFPEHAVAAYTALDGTIFKGRMLHIIGGKEGRTGDKAADGKPVDADAKSSFKKDKAHKQTAAAGSAHNWNSLFLGADAVADLIAHKLDTDKGTLLDAEGDGSLAVRMALAETRVVHDTRQFLLKNGVQLDSFSRPSAARSNTVMIVKNLPAGTTSDQLRPVFERFGTLGRLVLPPEGGISALVEFVTASEAALAFKALAYSRFGSVPLFLEWAPGDVFGAEAIAAGEQQLQAEASGAVHKKDKPKKSKKHQKENIEQTDTTTAETNEDVKTAEESTELKTEQEPDELPSDEPEPDTTIFVKNLNFETTDEQLRGKFEQLGAVHSATVSRKKDPKRAGQMLSMGFGFVQYRLKRHAQDALKQLQGVLLNGHALELKLSNRQVTAEHPDAYKRKSTSATEQGECSKILVRNVPFQASQKDVTELFNSFGELSFVRLPRKVSSGAGKQHRGFAFVQFVSKQDAARAFAALCHSTHLYGRRLVLEWAHEDAEIEKLRAKTAEHFATGADRKKHGKQRARIKETLEAIDPD